MPVEEQGATPDRYMLIPRTLIFLTRDENVLLIKGAADKRLWANRYNGIGGHVERGEGVFAAARRELLEEAGLSSPDLRLCGTVTIDTGPNFGILLFVFKGSCPEGEAVDSLEGTPEWVPLSTIGSLPLVEDLYTLLPRVLAMHPGERPFSAHYHYDEADRLVISFDG